MLLDCIMGLLTSPSGRQPAPHPAAWGLASALQSLTSWLHAALPAHMAARPPARLPSPPPGSASAVRGVPGG